ALAGLGFVVVKALGGEEVKLAEGMQITPPPGKAVTKDEAKSDAQHAVYRFPEGCTLRYTPHSEPMPRSEAFLVAVPAKAEPLPPEGQVTLPAGCEQLVPGSSWGTFTIACTIPIALFVGFYMYRLRPGRVVEASLIGGALTIAAVIVGNWVPGSPLE